ncbi:hypothetical protein COI79_32665 [Bacillus thuringiensis]|uniref:zinc-ribbon domain-containing protein n=1 Tax=Bacillus thuringiensis TaxID=1428 RepID=UPI000BF26270|nr:zinc-ribbon domain-containing protein [Bacillus thuringiensis]PEU80997.1 hypothetical protein CN411_24730 [Bacillus thuringiensis]PFH99910.1 hypothetical protein COI79_32665 [Bacillus thuringiensis]PGY76698.1 hypothetical protein COE44_17210 [Bacillus thuringiensis]
MKVWWKCEKGHEWKTEISSRTSKNTKCPYCIGRLATPETCLQATHPMPINLRIFIPPSAKKRYSFLTS